MASAGSSKTSETGDADTYAGPLVGLTVLDCSRLLPGPYATQILRDLGARVIKIEDNAGGDYCRYYPPLGPDGNSTQFHALNRGKQSIILDFKKPTDLAAFRQLVTTADVVVESFRPGVMSRLGVGPTELLKLNPRLIYCAISGYGQTGPDRLRAGHDMNYLARAGVLGMSRAPANVLPVQVADLAGGALPAVIQILAALRGRDSGGASGKGTGKGAVIDVSMTDNSYALLVMPHARYSTDPTAPIGNGQDVLVGAYPCYEIYPCGSGSGSAAGGSGQLAVGSLEPKFWSVFCNVIGAPDLISKQFCQGAEGEAVKQTVREILSKKSLQEWTRLFRLPENDACVEPVLVPENVATTDPQLKARQLTIDFTIPATPNSGGAAPAPPQLVTVPKMPLRMTGLKPPAAPGPALGQHTKQVLATIKSKL